MPKYLPQYKFMLSSININIQYFILVSMVFIIYKKILITDISPKKCCQKYVIRIVTGARWTYSHLEPSHAVHTRLRKD